MIKAYKIAISSACLFILKCTINRNLFKKEKQIGLQYDLNLRPVKTQASTLTTTAPI